MNTKESWITVEEFDNGNKLLRNNFNIHIIVNNNGAILCELKNLEVLNFNEGIGIINKQNRYFGYVNIDGEIICECRYRCVWEFEYGLGLVGDMHNGYPSNLINRFGIEILPPIYKQVAQSENYIMAVKKGEEYEILLDKKLRVIFDSDKCFYNIREIRKDLFAVKIDENDHLVNLEGKVLTSDAENFARWRKFEMEADRGPCGFGFNVLYRNLNLKDNIVRCFNSWGLRDEGDNTYFNFEGVQFLELCEIINSRRLIKINEYFGHEKYGYLDESAKLVIPCNFEYADNFINGRALVKDKKGCYFIDVDGNKVNEIINYSIIDRFDNSFAIVGKSNLQGIIDLDGNEIVSCMFHKIERLKNKFFRTSIEDNNGNRKYGCLNQKCVEVLPPIYDFIFDFSSGFSIVIDQNQKYGLINIEGVFVLPLNYDLIKTFEDGLAIISQNGKCGFIDTKLNIVVPIIYDKVDPFNGKNTTGVCLDGEWLKIERTGVVIIDDYGYDHDKMYTEYTDSELRDMYRGAFEGFPDAEWNVD